MDKKTPYHYMNQVKNLSGIGEMRKLIKAFPLIYLIFVTLWLRLINLGYSDYQGDEIKALYRPEAGQGISEFLFSQRKGPIQFFVTYIIKIFNPNYDNELFVRLPFAVAGILAVYFFYKLVKLHFGEKIALYSAFFMATNGLFVAFARIAQYQSLVILFSILALYFLSLYMENEKWRVSGLYLGIIFWGFSILAHFDGIFIAPFVCYVLYSWYTDKSILSKEVKFKHLSFTLLILVGIIASFYVPFFLSVSESTKEYWANRISTRPEDSISTFKIYNPIFVIYLYAILGALSLSKIKKTFSVIVWFLFPFVVMEVLVSQPGTHIYTYILPFCIFIAYGLERLEFLVSRKSKVNFKFLSIKAVMCLLLFLLAHVMFVDHSKEYAWEDKNFLMIELPKKHKQSAFAFPYYRHWEDIGTYIKTVDKRGYYLTNEKKSIARYYVPTEFKNVELEAEANKLLGYTYLIHIKNPQTRNENILGKKPSYWEQYEPVKTFSNNGRIVAKIYRLSGKELEKMRQ